MLSKTKAVVLRSVIKPQTKEQIVKHSKKAGEPLAESSVYAMLSKLIKEGLVEKIEQVKKPVKKKTTTKSPAKKPKPTYKYEATKEGIKVIKNEKKVIAKYLKFLEIK